LFAAVNVDTLTNSLVILSEISLTGELTASAVIQSFVVMPVSFDKLSLVSLNRLIPFRSLVLS